MTPDTVKLFARYNMHANAEMGRVLAQLTEDEWTKELGGYYPSIRSLCSHVFISDLTWLRRFASLRLFSYAQHPVFQQTPALGDLLFATFRDYEVERKTLDERFAGFADEVQAEDLAKRLRYKNFKGIDQDRDFGGLVLHTFNHETHHRGMIALYLDMLGKQNDFSNLMVLV